MTSLGFTSSGSFASPNALRSASGFRIDATVMLIRFDFGFPLRIPYLPDGERWVANDIRLGSAQWRKDNLILNVAFGFPF